MEEICTIQCPNVVTFSDVYKYIVPYFSYDYYSVGRRDLSLKNNYPSKYDTERPANCHYLYVINQKCSNVFKNNSTYPL